MERKLLGISLLQHRTNVEIRQITKVKNVREKARELKWECAAHVTRMQPDRWPKNIEQWIPQGGKRKVGKQKKPMERRH